MVQVGGILHVGKTGQQPTAREGIWSWRQTACWHGLGVHASCPSILPWLAMHGHGTGTGRVQEAPSVGAGASLLSNFIVQGAKRWWLQSCGFMVLVSPPPLHAKGPQVDPSKVGWHMDPRGGHFDCSLGRGLLLILVQDIRRWQLVLNCLGQVTGS